ncbi:hypothetical protein [Modestobacter marinus]|uniref:hypothetical protein n=1 Tax=Modestobacter marinus TaxID=477641 RepID=UPI001C98B8F7|nr:hypothetical protein [Modestobacter marinus]
MSGPDWDAVPPYSGPPRWQPPPPQQWPPPPWPPASGWPPGSGWPAPGWVRPPRRPGVVITAAVLAFVSAGFVALGTVYAMVFSALLAVVDGPAAGLGPWIALVQLAVVGALVTAGVQELRGRPRWLRGAAAAQVALSIYWAVVLGDVTAVPVSDAALSVPVVFAALALAAGGCTVLPEARAWAARAPGRRGMTGAV